MTVSIPVYLQVLTMKALYLVRPPVLLNEVMTLSGHRNMY